MQIWGLSEVIYAKSAWHKECGQEISLLLMTPTVALKKNNKSTLHIVRITIHFFFLQPVEEGLLS